MMICIGKEPQFDERLQTLMWCACEKCEKRKDRFKFEPKTKTKIEVKNEAERFLSVS